MKNNFLATLGVAAFGLALSATATFAASLQPGETMGIAALSPLPEGVFFLDLEDYGKTDGVNQRVGINIPLIAWSTPWSFYNTRLEFIAALPFAHFDGAINQVGAITQAYGPIFAHDFGNGLTGGLATLIRTPDPSQFFSNATGRTKPQADIRGGLYYTMNGFHFYETSYYTGAFGRSNYVLNNESIGVDFSATKTIDKFEFGFVGFAVTDIKNNSGGGRVSQVELGGEIAYDFGKITLQAQVTRGVYDHNTSLIGSQPHETRGWLRAIVPLYVAPTAAPIVARY